MARVMALTDAQVGPRAAWLRRHRKAKYGTGDGGLVALAKAMRDLGFDRSWSTYKGWESSDLRSPIPAEAEPYLERLFGEPVPDPAPILGGDVAAAIDRQTTAITSAIESQTRAYAELLAELQSFRLQQLSYIRALAGDAPEHEPMPGDDPAPSPRGAAPTRSQPV